MRDVFPLLKPLLPWRTDDSKMEAPFQNKLVGSVHGLVRTELLMNCDLVDGKCCGFIVHRRRAHVPLDERRLNRPMPRYLVFRAGAKGIAGMLIE